MLRSYYFTQPLDYRLTKMIRMTPRGGLDRARTDFAVPLMNDVTQGWKEKMTDKST